jgi:hypothetical protein
MEDRAHRTLITTALRPKDGQPNLAGFIRGRGGEMTMPVTIG